MVMLHYLFTDKSMVAVVTLLRINYINLFKIQLAVLKIGFIRNSSEGSSSSLFATKPL